MGDRFDKEDEQIQALAVFLATEEPLQYLMHVCDAPFRSTLHRPSVDKLDDLFQQGIPVFAAVPLPLRDQLPNLLKAYVKSSDFLFGYDPKSDAAMV